jgi:hypothetical protein
VFGFIDPSPAIQAAKAGTRSIQPANEASDAPSTTTAAMSGIGELSAAGVGVGVPSRSLA